MNKNKNSDIANKIASEETFVALAPQRKDPNAIYLEDNPQKALEKLLTLSSNESYQEKLQYVKHFAELIEMIGDDGIGKLKEITAFIRNDRDDIKRAFLIQMTPLIEVLQGKGDQGYKEIVGVLVPLVSKLIDSNSYEIKEECGQQFAKLAEVLNTDDRGQYLLTTVLGLAHDDDNEENRMIAVRLLSQMAPLFGKDLCEQFVGLEFLSMGEDPQLRVRKEAVANLPSIGKVVSPQFFRQKLLPFYLKLCKDSHWGVRKSCIDIIYEISNLCKDDLAEIRENELTEAILNFIKDSNKWVKISAYKNLGRFISTLEGLRVSERLVENYLHMADSNVNSLGTDSEIIHACAFNFPAVVLTLGPNKWPVLVRLFQTLVKSNDKVRKPIACSLHEIAKIIGEERAERDLVVVLERFLKDTNDEIKYGAIQNLAFFLKVFRMEKRENMVDIFLDLQKDPKKWRIRELIANQIDKLTLIFSPETTFRIIAPISFKLCSDTVAFVREEASRKIHAVLKAVYNSEEVYRISVIENIKGFSQDKRFTNRQAYAIMCEKLMKSPEIFRANFLACLIPLANDKVPNVRIALAKTLHKVFLKKRAICSDPEIIQLVLKLKNDPSKDVKSLIKDIQIDAPVEEKEQAKQVNGETEIVTEKTEDTTQVTEQIEPAQPEEVPSQVIDVNTNQVEETKEQDQTTEPAEKALQEEVAAKMPEQSEPVVEAETEAKEETSPQVEQQEVKPEESESEPQEVEGENKEAKEEEEAENQEVKEEATN